MKIIAAILLPLVLQSYEDAAKQLADNLAKAENALVKVGVADDYVKLLNKFPKSRADIVDAASDAYSKAWPDLDPVWKLKTRERLAKLYAPKVPGKTGPLPEGFSGPVDNAHKAMLSAERVHSGGSAIKLIPGAKARNARMLYTAAVEIPKKSKKVEYSIWVLSDETDSLDDHVRFYLSDKDQKPISVPQKGISKDFPIWTKLTFEAEGIPEDAVRANIEVVSFSKAGVIFVDDLSIKVDGKEGLKNGSLDR